MVQSDSLIDVPVLALAHYDEKSMSLYEGSAEAMGSFLIEGIWGRGGLGVQSLVLKGLRLSYPQHQPSPDCWET